VAGPPLPLGKRLLVLLDLLPAWLLLDVQLLAALLLMRLAGGPPLVLLEQLQCRAVRGGMGAGLLDARERVFRELLAENSRTSLMRTFFSSIRRGSDFMTP
jgi:hypothetical protein